MLQAARLEKPREWQQAPTGPKRVDITLPAHGLPPPVDFQRKCHHLGHRQTLRKARSKARIERPLLIQRVWTLHHLSWLKMNSWHSKRRRHSNGLSVRETIFKIIRVLLRHEIIPKFREEIIVCLMRPKVLVPSSLCIQRANYPCCISYSMKIKTKLI